MKALKERILQDGRCLEGGILKVDNFINHQIDATLMMDIAKECQHVAIGAGAKHVSAYIKVVYQPEGEVLTIDRKITKHAEA